MQFTGLSNYTIVCILSGDLDQATSTDTFNRLCRTAKQMPSNLMTLREVILCYN